MEILSILMVAVTVEALTDPKVLRLQKSGRPQGKRGLGEHHDHGTVHRRAGAAKDNNASLGRG